MRFENYISTIPGDKGVPLSYSVRSQEAPDCTKYFQGNFISVTIDCTPLSIAHSQADTMEVHQFLNKYLMAETFEQWIIIIEKRVNGWDSFDAL